MLLFHYSNFKNTGYKVYWLFSATLYMHDIGFVPETLTAVRPSNLQYKKRLQITCSYL